LIEDSNQVVVRLYLGFSLAVRNIFVDLLEPVNKLARPRFKDAVVGEVLGS
jgi:hypothetical protein